jgi:hypothetical protein
MEIAPLPTRAPAILAGKAQIAEPQSAAVVVLMVFVLLRIRAIVIQVGRALIAALLFVVAV